MKKLLSIFLVIAMLVTTCTVSAAYYTDIDGHWAEKEIEAWSDHGVISGYDGKFSPDRNITRGEFAVVLNRLMSYQKESSNIFKDLPDKFYTTSVLKLYKAGVMQGYNGSISPEASLTREEASVMICRALGIETADKMDRAFSDEANISSWSKAYINALVNSGLLNGADGKLNPKKPIMRSEVVKILDNAVFPILKTGTIESVKTNKIVVISAGNVTVKNSEIKGKVIVTQGVETGKVSFVDSKVENNFVIDNNSKDVVEIDNTTVTGEVIIKEDADVSDEKEQGGSSDSEAGGSSGGAGGSSGGAGGSSGGAGGSSGGAGGSSGGAGGSSGGAGGSSGGAGGSSGGDSGLSGGNSGEDSEMVNRLKEVSTEIAPYIDRNSSDYTIFTNTEKSILRDIKKCIDDAVNNHANELDANFIKATYADEIAVVHETYDKMVAEEKDDAFIGRMAANFTIYNLVWLADTLGVDLEKYGINPSDYL